MADTKRSPLRGWLVRALGSAVLLGLLLWWLPLEEVTAGFARVPLATWVAVWALFAAGHIAAAAKWWQLLGRAMAFGTAIRAHFAGLAANLCLPGAAGGDVVRAGVAQMAIRDGGKVISGSVADRLIDMLALAILTGAGALGLASGAAGGALALQALGMMALALVGAFWVAPRFVPWLWGRFPALPARSLALKTAAEFGALAGKPFMLVSTLALSTAIQALFVILAMWLGSAVGVALPAAVWFFAWPLAKLLAVLPIALNGLGLREATLAGLMVPFGASGAEVVAAGLAWQAVLFATGILGAIVLALSGFSLRANPVVE